MPQIAQLSETFASQLFWLLLTFGVVFFFIGRGMLPKVTSTIDQRDKSVADDLAAAEAARTAADATEERWRVQENAARETAQKALGAARAKAAGETEQALAAGNATIDARVSEAEARIAAATAAASGEIETVAAEAAADIVARLSGVTVDVATARGAVKAVLNG